MKKILLLITLIIGCSSALFSQCTTAVFSISEDFSTNAGALPDCWERHFDYPNNASTSDVSIQSNELWVNNYYGGEAILPLTVNMKGVITLRARQEVTSGGNLVFAVVATDGNGNFSELATFTLSSTMSTYSYDLSQAFVSGNYSKIGLRGASGSNRSARAIIDDVTYNSACSPNSPVTASTKNITISLDENGQATIAPEDVDDGSENQCGNAATLALDKTQFTCTDLGDNTVTLTATVNNATDTETATVRVIPFMPEENETIYTYLDANGNATLSTADFASKNACTGVTYSFDAATQTSFTCSEKNNQFTTTLTANFGNGESESRNVTVIPKDTLAPIVTTQNITIQLDNNGIATADDSDYVSAISDNCSQNFVYSFSKTEFNYEDIGVNQVDFTVDDGNGNISSHTVQVTVETGFTQYTATANNTNSQCVDGSTAFDITLDGSDTGLDYYLLDTLANNVVDGPVPGTGNPITFSTGTLTATSTYKVATQLSYTNSSTGSAISFFNDKSYTEAAGTWNFNYTNGYTFEATINGNTRPSGSQNVIFSIGTTGQSDIEVYFQDNTGYLVIAHERQSSAAIERYTAPPAFTDTHIAITYAPYNTKAISVYYDGVLQTKATGGITGNSLGKSSTHQFKLGKVSHTAFGNTSNSGLIIDEVRVWDAPRTAATIQTYMNSCVDPGAQGLMHYYQLDEGTGTEIKDLAVGGLDMNLIDTNPTTSNWRTAGYGLINCPEEVFVTVSNQVTIGDLTAPTTMLTDFTAALDATGQVTINASDANNGSSDNCTDASALTFSADQTQFSCEDIGDQNVTITIADEAGNTTSAAVTVTVADTLAPVINPNNRDGLGSLIPSKSFELDSAGQLSITIEDLMSTVTDNCDSNPTVTLSQSTFGCDDAMGTGTIGTNQTVTISATDIHGNTSTATESFSIVDPIAPVITAKDVTLQLDATGNVTLSPDDVFLSASDNCTNATDLIYAVSQSAFDCSHIGSNSINYSATDSHGNITTVDVTVTIEDSTAPIAIAQDISVELDQSGSVTITPEQIDNGSSDNCSFTLALDKTTFTSADLGSNQVVLTVTDDSENSSTDTVMITVEEKKIAQTITFPTLNPVTYGAENQTLTASTTSGLDVSFTVSNGPGTIVNGNELQIDGAGSITVVASQAGSSTYSAADDVSQTITVAQAILVVSIDDKTITYGEAIPAYTYSYQGFQHNDTPEDLAIEPAIGSIASNNSDAGTYSIDVLKQGEDDNYAFQYNNGTLTINKADQVITFATIDDVDLATTSSVTLDATANTGMDVSFVITTGATIATIADDMVTFSGTGTVTIEATQSGNTNYNAATSSQTITVSDSRKQSQTISFSNIADQTYGAQVSLDATASSTLPITYTLTSGAGTISNGTLTIESVGDFTITASQDGNDQFDAAQSVAISFTVSKASLTVSVDDETIIAGDSIPTFTLSYSGFQLNDDENSLDELPTASTTATSQSPTGDYTISLTGGSDAHYNYVLTDGTLTIEKALSSERLDLVIYPNPVAEMIYVSGQQPTSMTLMSLEGKLLQTNKESNQMDVAALKAGIYILQILSDDGKMHTQTVLKQ